MRQLSNHLKFNIGIVGAGEFAEFAAKAFLKINGIHIVGVTDINEASGRKMAVAVNAKFHNNITDLLTDDSIDLVYIATPPYLHFRQSEMAFRAGKHVICEKPAALRTIEAETLAAYAKENNLLYVVNLMQRYNPLYAIVKTIIDEKWLGDFVHGFFENYASDEKLIPEHWFWDEEKSGGIFIEHGVHFFDMFSGWLGEGELISSFEIQRPGVEEKIIDRVQADVLYQDGPVNFYHGFNQPKLLDRQELRLQFDRGDITLYEWIPVKIRLHGLLKVQQVEKLKSLFPGCKIEVHSDDSTHKKVRGKFRDIDFDSLITMESGDIADKMFRYEQLVTSMLEDQLNWIKDPSQVRKIDDTNAVESLRMAEEATKRAAVFAPKSPKGHF
ncbi:MAG: Gfo/Idh/MocA family oxidoreductase [Saprospiraceae bacterium]|uniref:Gfo/Idh/MocA family oxidoreductase n=1 Tax=Candidatus Opimibacter skivensis TaxID=2982028 RepID=A0A9D7SU08_9BACT|nr:Gfo/Idh/MocA family oxidoreductase [Candidatus Opimibacter skivensis]